MSQQDRELELLVLELLERALGEPSETRAAFIENAAGYSAQVRGRAQAVLAGGNGAASLRTDGVDAFSLTLAEPPKRIGAYRIIREIGRGGMGAVFQGERDQGDFDHSVAIKIIATGRLSPALISRFAQERQILARLNHPHIARLYDGGETQSGLPYLVMELVEGQPLNTWLHNVPGEEACFSVFTKMLEAVAYAHRTLVIHRDLTPNNVIVTPGGGVKIIDFGISSFPSAAGASLISGQTATPGFAAPESGEDDGPNTAIDIYALGKLMQLMFQRFGHRELAAIAGKAAADDPKRRYATVAQMADDIARFRSGYTVDAFDGGYSYRSKKYIRRNWLPLTAAAAIALVLAVSVSLLANAYRQEQSARQLAANRFDAVRDLAQFQLFDLYDAMDEIPNTVRARQLLARNSIAYLNSLAITPDAPPDLRREVGEGWLRLSQVTGGSSGDNIGLPEQAFPFGDRALDVLESLLHDYPDDIEARVSLGTALASLALDSLYTDGDSDTGYARAARAVDVLADVTPYNEKSAVAIARGYWSLGDAYGWKNDLPQAGIAYAQGLEFIDGLVPALQQAPGVMRAKGAQMRQLAEVHRYTGAPDLALAQMRATVDFNEQMLANTSQASTSSVPRNLVISLWNISDMHRSLAQWNGGLQYAERAWMIVTSYIEENPEDIGWLELRPLVSGVIAQLKSGLGDHQAAVKSANSTIADLRTLRDKSGANVGTDLAIAVGWKDVAHVYLAAGDTASGCAGLQEAYTIFITYDQSGDLSEYDRQNNLAPVQAALKAC